MAAISSQFYSDYTFNPHTHGWVKFLEDCGTVAQVLVPLSTAAYGLYKKDYRGVGYLGVLFIVNQIVIEVLKSIFPEQRPNGRSRSFPSGHTMAACLGTACLFRRYGWHNIPTPLAIGSIICSSFVGGTRVLARAHWVQDVVAGFFLGYLLSYFFPPL